MPNQPRKTESRIEFQFHDLPAVAGGRLWGVPRHSIEAIVQGLVWNRLVWDTGSGEDGQGGASIIVYRDDARQFRCFFHDRMDLRDAQVFTTNTQVRTWLAQWHPRLQPITKTDTPKRRAAE